MKLDSKAYSHKWFTASDKITRGPCEVVFAFLTSGAAAGTATIYKGQDSNADVLVVLEATTNISQQIHFDTPAYCPVGLYLNLDANCTGCFVMWRELPN